MPQNIAAAAGKTPEWRDGTEVGISQSNSEARNGSKERAARNRGQANSLPLTHTELELIMNNDNAAISLPELKDGEIYAGFILTEDGMPDYHLILIPADAENINWNDAMAWAKEQGCDLPTRREQALLFANQRNQFKSAPYWSSSQHEAGSDCAWSQTFGYGYQYCNDTYIKLRARAVRRLPIQ